MRKLKFFVNIEMKFFKSEDFDLLFRTAPSLRQEKAAQIANAKLGDHVKIIRRIAAEHALESFQGGLDAGMDKGLIKIIELLERIAANLDSLVERGNT